MRIFTLLLAITLGKSILAQDSLKVVTNSNDSLLRAALLGEMSKQHNANNELLNRQLTDFDKKLQLIDKKIENENNSQRKVEALVERVQILEKKEVANVDNLISVYEHNYKAAVVNLVFMERELKPLVLFDASRDFFSGLGDACNPTNYRGYNEWFNKFKAHIEQNKSKVRTFALIDQAMKLSGSVGKDFVPLAGPLANQFLNGIGDFIVSLGKKNKALIAESEQMFKLSAILSQFVHERDLIENEWESINKKLDELQKLHTECLKENFIILGIEEQDFRKNFANEMDANRRFDYIRNMTQKIKERIKSEKDKNPDKWKTLFYQQMQTVKSLKIRFGELTFRIKENITKYQGLIQKYAQSELPEMKENMNKLATKLERLNSSFDATFNPQAYIKAADRMYIED